MGPGFYINKEAEDCLRRMGSLLVLLRAETVPEIIVLVALFANVYNYTRIRLINMHLNSGVIEWASITALLGKLTKAGATGIPEKYLGCATRGSGPLSLRTSE